MRGFSHTNPSEDDKGGDISYKYSYFNKVDHTCVVTISNSSSTSKTSQINPPEKKGTFRPGT